MLLLLPAATPAAVYVVNTHLDNGSGTLCSTGGSCSLRAAVAAAAANPGTDRIEFDLPQGTVIALQSTLGTIGEKLIIDARPYTSYTGRPQIELNGLVTSNVDGLRFGNGAAGSAVYGLSITDFDQSGIEIAGDAHMVTIDGCEIGRKASGLTAGNGSGILAHTDGNTIGKRYVEGTGFVGVGNLVVASAGDGISITGDANTVYGNTLGDTVASTGNGVGIRVHLGNHNHIGRAESGERGGNGVYFSVHQGIVVNGDVNLVQNNSVGRTTGGSNRPNGGDGIVVGGQSNVVGGTESFEHNLVAGNQTGIAVGASGGDGFNEITGNQVLDNRGTGIRIVAGVGNFVQDNNVHGNGTGGIGDGVRIDGDANVVRRNRIGVDNGNSGEGVYINIGADSNTVGPGNTIAGNSYSGVKIQGKFNEVSGNYIGRPDAPNNLHGVWLVGGSDQSIVASNDIHNNAGVGIRVDSDDSILQGNEVGITGANALAGVHLGATASGTQVGPGNHIGENKDGIVVEGSDNVLLENWIGIRPDLEYHGNDRYGIHVRAGAGGNRLVSNYVQASGSHGVLVQGPATVMCGNIVGKYIDDGALVGHSNEGHGVFIQGVDGTDLSGTSCGFLFSNVVLHNLGDGIAIEDASGTAVWLSYVIGNGLSGIALLGGAEGTSVLNNWITDNGSKAIHVGHNAGERNRFGRNAMGGNDVPGIDLVGEGPTANDPGDADEGPNRVQNTPVLHFHAETGDGSLEVGYSIDTDLGNATWPLTVEIFRGAPLAGDAPSLEGLEPLGTGTYTAPGVASVTVNAPSAPSGWLIATATDADGNTSEFSAAVAYVLTSVPEIFRDGFEE